MRKALPSILVVITLMTSSTSFADSAGEMLSRCRQYETAKTNEDRITVTPDYDTGICWGAFSVIQELGNWYNPEEKQMWLGFCPPSEARRSQHILIFMKYAKSHPERLHEDFVKVALGSLNESWPCRPIPGRPPSGGSLKKK